MRTWIDAYNDIIIMKSMIHEVFIHDIIKEYIVKIIHKTRTSSSISVGASPRATLSLIKACQAYTALHGRNFVTTEDVKYIAPFVLAHRLVIPSMYNTSNSSINIICSILNEVPLPTEDFTNNSVFEI